MPTVFQWCWLCGSRIVKTTKKHWLDEPMFAKHFRDVHGYPAKIYPDGDELDVLDCRAQERMATGVDKPWKSIDKTNDIR